MNFMREAERLELVLKRDGFEEAMTYLHRMYKVYRNAGIDRRKKYGRTDSYRALYVEGAYSFRHLLRTNFLLHAEKFDK